MPPRTEARVNEQVAAMVRRELAKNPDVGNSVLREKAVGIDRGVRRLSPRQFHATYRLPALRGAQAAARAAKAAAGAKHDTASGSERPTTGVAPTSQSTTNRGSGPQQSVSRPSAASLTDAPARGTDAAATAAHAATAHAPPVASSDGDGGGRATSAASAKVTGETQVAAVGSDGAEAPRLSPSKALARPHAAEREAVRAILQTVAREALATEDRGAFVRLLDSLDERAAHILGLFHRA